MTSTNWPPNITIDTPLPRRSAQSFDRQTQAAHDAEVVREILAGCRLERQRRRRWFIASLGKALGRNARKP